jgi:hypothetical protein
MPWLNWNNKPLTTERRAQIEKLVALGQSSFILRVGILRWALPVFLLTIAFDYLYPFRTHRSFDASLMTLSIRLAVWIGAGCFFGNYMWNLYNALLDRDNRS